MHDEVGADERGADVAEDHGLPQVGVEVLHAGQHGAEQRGADGQLHGRQDAAERHAEGDPDDEDREPGGQSGDGLGAGAGVQHALEEQDGHVAGRADARPEQQGAGHEHLGVGTGQDVPQLDHGRGGPAWSGRPRLPEEADGDSRTRSRTASPVRIMMAPAIWKGRSQVAGSDCFHVAITVPLMVKLASVPRTVVSTNAFSQRLRPNTSGTTATLVRVNTDDAWLAMTMKRTRGQ